jgi:hypothetical protein
MPHPLSAALRSTLTELASCDTLSAYGDQWPALQAVLGIPQSTALDSKTFVDVTPALREFPAPFEPTIVPFSRAVRQGLRLITDSASSSSSTSASRSEIRGWACVGMLVNIYTSLLCIQMERPPRVGPEEFRVAVTAAASITGVA